MKLGTVHIGGTIERHPKWITSKEVGIVETQYGFSIDHYTDLRKEALSKLAKKLKGKWEHRGPNLLVRRPGDGAAGQWYDFNNDGAEVKLAKAYRVRFEPDGESVHIHGDEIAPVAPSGDSEDRTGSDSGLTTKPPSEQTAPEPAPEPEPTPEPEPEPTPEQETDSDTEQTEQGGLTSSGDGEETESKTNTDSKSMSKNPQNSPLTQEERLDAIGKRFSNAQEYYQWIQNTDTSFNHAERGETLRYDLREYDADGNLEIDVFDATEAKNLGAFDSTAAKKKAKKKQEQKTKKKDGGLTTGSGSESGSGKIPSKSPESNQSPSDAGPVSSPSRSGLVGIPSTALIGGVAALAVAWGATR